MASSFFGFNVALRGLFSAQRHLDVVSHNVSNATTPGYSRQMGIQTASRPMSLRDGTGMLGTGSEVNSVERIRNTYLDTKYWNEAVTAGEWDVKCDILGELEATFNEPSNSGFTTVFNDFYSALQELTKDPSSDAVRSLVRQRAVTVTKYFNNAATRFEQMQADLNDNVRIKVDEVNSYASQIQQLNKQIYTVEVGGDKANDLRDQRDLLVDKLSRLIPVEAGEVAAGKLPDGTSDMHFTVTINGKALVDHFNISRLEVTQRQGAKQNPEDIENLYQVGWADKSPLTISGGELKGYMDIRDGNGANGAVNGVPYYMRKLNEFAQTFAMAFNEGYIDADGSGTIESGEAGTGHVSGVGSDGVGRNLRFFTVADHNGEPVKSSDFIDEASIPSDDMSTPQNERYDYIQSKYQNISAKSLMVSDDIMEHQEYIAVSAAGTGIENTDVLKALITQRQNGSMFSEGTPEDFMKSLVAGLGIDSEQAIQYSKAQTNIVSQINNRRLAVSGVSMDEEMVNMVKSQQAYNAAAKMIATMGEIYDTLINRTGL